VLGGLAEFERELILARTSDGRARAKARGVRFGRPSALTPHQRQEAIQRLEEGATQADLARTTAYRRRPLAGWRPHEALAEKQSHLERSDGPSRRLQTTSARAQVLENAALWSQAPLSAGRAPR
jgi:hypothetical protein